jgi:arsenate reductase
MRKVFYLSTCSTCTRILKEWNLPSSIFLQNIKENLYTESEVDEMKKMVGSYEALFSKKSMKYKAWDVKEKIHNDEDYREFLMKDYTFLKRPVLVFDEHIFVGNSKENVEKAKQFLSTLR